MPGSVDENAYRQTASGAQIELTRFMRNYLVPRDTYVHVIHSDHLPNEFARVVSPSRDPRVADLVEGTIGIKPALEDVVLLLGDQPWQGGRTALLAQGCVIVAGHLVHLEQPSVPQLGWANQLLVTYFLSLLLALKADHACQEEGIVQGEMLACLKDCAVSSLLMSCGVMTDEDCDSFFDEHKELIVLMENLGTYALTLSDFETRLEQTAIAPNWAAEKIEEFLASFPRKILIIG